MTFFPAASVIGRSSLPSADREAPIDRLGMFLTCSVIVGVTFLAKFGILFPRAQIPVAVPIIAVSLFLGLTTGRIQPHRQRLAVYLGLTAALVAIDRFRETPGSVTSLLLLIAIHLPYGFQSRATPAAKVHAFYQFVATILAMCGLVQFGSQYIVASDYTFSVDNFIPGFVNLTGYNYLIPVSQGSIYYKSNGIFMLEPSFFSELLAVALAIELATAARLTRIGLFLLASIVSYSGSGLVAIAAFGPISVIHNKRAIAIVFLMLCVAGVFIGSNYLNLDVFWARVGEFGATTSSASARYVGGFYLFDQYLLSDVPHMLFGYGSGATGEYAGLAQIPVAEVTWVKMLFEYGIIGGLVYFAALYYFIFTNDSPIVLKIALGVIIQLNGSLVIFAHALIVTLLLWPTYPRTAKGNLRSGMNGWAPGPGGAAEK